MYLLIERWYFILSKKVIMSRKRRDNTVICRMRKELLANCQRERESSIWQTYFWRCAKQKEWKNVWLSRRKNYLLEQFLAEKNEQKLRKYFPKQNKNCFILIFFFRTFDYFRFRRFSLHNWLKKRQQKWVHRRFVRRRNAHPWVWVISSNGCKPLCRINLSAEPNEEQVEVKPISDTRNAFIRPSQHAHLLHSILSKYASTVDPL